MIVLSFDPGITGAGAILGKKTGPVVFDLPSIEIKAKEGSEAAIKRRLDARGLYQLLLQHLQGEEDIHAVTEALATGGRSSTVMTIGSQYRTRGALESVVDLVGLELEEVYPATWKKLYGLQGKADNKVENTKLARETAVKLYPDLADFLQRAKDHNRAEAVLIGHWYRRELLRRFEVVRRVPAASAENPLL